MAQDEITLTDVERAVRGLLSEVDIFASRSHEERERCPWKGRRERLVDTLRLQRVRKAPEQQTSCGATSSTNTADESVAAVAHA